MKILAIVGSHRKNGNTAHVVELIGQKLQEVAEAHQEPLEFEIVYPSHMNLQLCRGCRICFDRGEDQCPLKDDIALIKAQMQAADGVIFASPVYVDDVSGTMKTLIDRLAYVCHRPAFAGKSAYIVATTGSSSTKHTIRTMQATISWGFSLVGNAGFKTGARMLKAEIEANFQQKADKIAHQLFKAVQRQRFAQPAFISLLVFRIQQHGWRQANPETLDYQYWDKQGWLDPRREFFIPHRANGLTVRLARTLGSVMARLWA